MNKQSYRDVWKKQFPQDPAVRAGLSLQLCQRLQAQSLIQTAPKIAIFYPRLFEVDLTALWRAYPDRCVFPKVVAQKPEALEFFWVKDLNDLLPAPMGLREPGSHCQKAAFSAEDLILVPGLAFDRFGGRVGSGKGYYDRFLQGLPEIAKWGTCFHAQIVKEKLAQIETDVRMDALCSDVEFFRVGPA